MPKSERFDFPNASGSLLSGRLELPETSARGYALLAHCFTCSKHVIAASVMARQLTRSGLGVLRFDFTGLGNSEGDFSNTNFSSNVEDLMAACRTLELERQAPVLMVGHSLGGTAVLTAAAKMESVKAVVTIGSPSSTHHLTRLFAHQREEIEERGLAQVILAGREFTIKRQFLRDLEQQTVLESVRHMNQALLILHAPDDQVVPLDHATAIFKAARHPKSFVCLDQANHLLSNRDDAAYAADLIGAWVSRYV